VSSRYTSFRTLSSLPVILNAYSLPLLANTNLLPTSSENLDYAALGTLVPTINSSSDYGSNAFADNNLDREGEDLADNPDVSSIPNTALDITKFNAL
jgi:4-hydroxybenzoate polyprenyltransferase